MTYFVNAYEIGTVYGGPEEGGWGYEVGTPADQSYGPYASRDAALDVYYALQGEVDLQNEGRPCTSSGASDGWFAFKIEEHAPRVWPETHPTYQ